MQFVLDSECQVFLFQNILAFYLFFWLDITLIHMFFSCLLGTLMGDPVVMASFYPNFPESVQSSSSSCGEFVFLLDRSGSMDFPMADIHHRTRIDSAKVDIHAENLPFSLEWPDASYFLFPLLRKLSCSSWRVYPWAAISTFTVLVTVLNTSSSKLNQTKFVLWL